MSKIEFGNKASAKQYMKQARQWDRRTKIKASYTVKKGKIKGNWTVTRKLKR